MRDWTDDALSVLASDAPASKRAALANKLEAEIARLREAFAALVRAHRLASYPLDAPIWRALQAAERELSRYSNEAEGEHG